MTRLPTLAGILANRPKPPIHGQLATEPGQVKEESIMSEEVITPTDYLPVPPTSEEAINWQDLPPADLEDAGLWLHRLLLKEMFDIKERSYFRWIDNLRVAGLTRSLMAQQDKKVRLFYRPDVEQALAQAQANANADGQTRRGRKSKALQTPAAAIPPLPAPQISAPPATAP